jgi:hypothetical protein
MYHEQAPDRPQKAKLHREKESALDKECLIRKYLDEAAEYEPEGYHERCCNFYAMGGRALSCSDSE